MFQFILHYKVYNNTNTLASILLLPSQLYYLSRSNYNSQFLFPPIITKQNYFEYFKYKNERNVANIARISQQQIK